MTTDSITTKAITVLLTATVDFAWVLIRVSQRWNAALDRLPWVPALLWRACRSVGTFGEYVEALAERTAERLCIDVLDVLAPITACAVAHHDAA